MMKIDDILALGPVMPVIVIDEAQHAVALADALLAGGICTIEVNLRTEAALDSVRAIRDARPDMVVGVGTIISPGLARAAVSAGAQFGVSPGSTDAVLDGCETAGLPLLPGATTVSEMMRLAERGYNRLKFFPASAAGGPVFLKSLISPLPDLRFCPTGGITESTAPDWLSLANIPCLGGSWIAPAADIQARDFAGITARAMKASHLGG